MSEVPTAEIVRRQEILHGYKMAVLKISADRWMISLLDTDAGHEIRVVLSDEVRHHLIRGLTGGIVLPGHGPNGAAA